MKTKNPVLTILIMSIFLFIIIGHSDVSAYTTDAETQATILYVRPGTLGTCTSWTDACDLQIALFNANLGDQVWVATGTYKPTTGTDRTATFTLKSGVAIYGGFPAAGGGLAERNWESNLTTLSGDIGILNNSTDNSYHVVTGSELDGNTILDGFTITLGYAKAGYPNDRGGGMYNLNGSPMLTNITFSGNTAYWGGGVSNSDSNPTLINVTFSENIARYDGGGMINNHSNPVLNNVTFSSNSSVDGGGGMYNNYSSPKLTNVTFSENTAGYGGGMDNSVSSPTLTNVTFSANIAKQYGGGMNNGVSSPMLTNVTFTGNTATTYGGGMSNYKGNPWLLNAILWGNIPEQINNNQSSLTITYSDIQGSYIGTGNIDEDPLLAILSNNGGFTQTHALGAESPAIDAGHPTSCSTSDQRDFYRPIDGDGDGIAVCDMGAYEYASIGKGSSFYLPLILR